MRARLWAAVGVAAALLAALPLRVQAAFVTFEWHGTVIDIQSAHPMSPPVALGDPVYLNLVLYDDPASSLPLYPYGPGPYPGQTFYWYPKSMHVEVGSQVLNIAPVPPYLATSASAAWTVVRNDAPFSATEAIDSLEVMYQEVWRGILFQMSTIETGSMVGPLLSGALSEAVAKAPQFEYSSLYVQLSSAGENYLVIAGPPMPAPEPGTLALLGLGLAGLVAARRRKQ